MSADDREAIQTLLTDPSLQSHAACLKANGIAFIPKLVDAHLLAAVQSDLAGWMSRKQWNADKHMGFDGNSGEAFLTESEAFCRMVANPSLLSLVSAHFGTLSPHLSFERTYIIDSIDPYERRAFQWHHDGWGRNQLKVMILLSDVGPEGQCMHYCPGTSDEDWPCTRSRETLFSPQFASSLRAIRCHGRAGDVFVFETFGVHRGVRNKGPRRDVMVLNFTKDLGRLYPVPRLHPKVLEDLHPYHLHILRQPVPEGKPTQEGEFHKVESGCVVPFNQSTARLCTSKGAREGEGEGGDCLREYLQEDQKRGAVLWKDFQLYGQSYTQSARPWGDLFRVDEPREKEIQQAGRVNRGVLDKLTRPLNLSELYGIESGTSLGNAQSEKEEKFRVPYWVDKGLCPSSFPVFVQLRFFESLHEDFDLPIRVRHPFRDQLRDNVITRLRDNDDSHVHILNRFDSLSVDLSWVSSLMGLGGYGCSVREETEALTKALLQLLKGEKGDSYGETAMLSDECAFACDLETMAKRAPSDAKRLGLLAFASLLADSEALKCEPFSQKAQDAEKLALRAFHVFVVGVMRDFTPTAVIEGTEEGREDKFDGVIATSSDSSPVSLALRSVTEPVQQLDLLAGSPLALGASVGAGVPRASTAGAAEERYRKWKHAIASTQTGRLISGGHRTADE
uniref:Uncharacterized protein n=1 Tax=Chromera velia CCMP2878 TaxID=1169474 RepID=A0A0G4HD32_9ALVE|eukprot:Cvel_26414.t1-p1 / transcript=Cvel_26414.t1 / gene=Cvel_26414 / organism=Chromera_velia_CCMP2878 / gene_product=hypothetical protein / transcript_product=hypothetical protein / location=Cvel_scaffold3135:14902-16929(-) / protein_length=676 / sequence_SO=supercontig / SO=protein_coding / is_pseudo=false